MPLLQFNEMDWNNWFESVDWLSFQNVRKSNSNVKIYFHIKEKSRIPFGALVLNETAFFLVGSFSIFVRSILLEVGKDGDFSYSRQ